MAGKSQELFEQMVRESGLNMAYDEFSAEMDAIINMQDPVAREKRLMSCYRGLTTMTASSAIMIRALMSWSDKYYSRYVGKVHTNAVLSEIAVTRVLDAYCQEKGFDYKCESKMGQSNEEYMQFLGGIANNITMARVHSEVFKIADEELYRKAVNNFAQCFRKDKKGEKEFSVSLGSDDDKTIADGYVAYEQLKAIHDKKGTLDMFRHPIDYWRRNSALRAAEKTFEKVGFNIAEHVADAKEMMESIPDPATVLDFNAINDYSPERQREIEMIKAMANAEEINVARSKFQKALDYVKNGVPDSDIQKVNDIYTKYGIKFETDGTGLPSIAHIDRVEESTASMFDTNRNLIAVQDHMKECFFRNLSNLVKGACDQVKDNGGKINISEVIKDASECINIVCDKVSIVFDAAETKDMAKNSTFGTYSAKNVTFFIQKFLTEAGQMDRYDLDEINAEVENLVNTYVHPLSQKARERDEKIANNEVEKTENVIVNDDNIIANDQPSEIRQESDRISFALDPKDVQDITGEVQPMIKDDAAVKEHTLNHSN